MSLPILFGLLFLVSFSSNCGFFEMLLLVWILQLSFGHLFFIQSFLNNISFSFCYLRDFRAEVDFAKYSS